MNIAYVTDFDVLGVLQQGNWPKRTGHWVKSYYLAESLKDESTTVQYLGPLESKFALLPKLKWRVYRQIFRQTYHAWAEPIFSQHYAAQISQKLSVLDSDIVFAPDLNLVAHLNCRQPIVLWLDSVLAGYIDFYADYSNLCQETIQHLKQLDQQALSNCKLIIFSSDWAAETAIKLYGVDSSKLAVVPFGPNLELDRDFAAVQTMIESRPIKPCKFLFLGVDWFRKGGNTAFQVVQKLNQMGIPSELTVVGCKPRITEPIPEYVKALGFINKSTQAGLEQMNQLLAESHFLILPSIADCTPHVLAEANSFGVPCLTTDVGGMPTVMRGDRNGKTFPLNAKIEDYCSYVKSLMQDYDAYKKLAYSTFQEYQTRLNWHTAGRTVKPLLENLLSSHS